MKGAAQGVLSCRSLVGQPSADSRHRYCAIGLDDWVTNDVDIYASTRRHQLPADIDALAQLRGELRARFAASPLRDAAGLACEVEAAYRALWRRWYEAETPAMCGKSMRSR